MKTNRKVQTQVFKAALDIGNSTLEDFLSELREAAKSQLHPQSRWLWVEEVRSGEVILAVEDDDYNTKYFRHEYKRNVDGTFEFGDGTKMKRISQFVVDTSE